MYERREAALDEYLRQTAVSLQPEAKALVVRAFREGWKARKFAQLQVLLERRVRDLAEVELDRE